MSDTVKVKFNDVEYELPAGLTVLKAALQIGISIPHFCWHKHLAISGNCRMCLVEVKPGPPKPAAACATPIADGMEVQTETEAIKAARKAVLEYTLIHHPLDCPVCDEAYECKLQDYTYAYGAEVSRFKDFHAKKRVYKREDLGKMFVEDNRCIECTRCVRYLRDVAGEYEYGRLYRGHHLKIGTYKDKLESDFMLNAADLCPVGTLEDKKFRFSARCWDLKRVPSVCPSCSIGCNIDIDSFDGKIKRLLPRENDAVNACWMCDSGRHNFDFVHEDRLTVPQVRTGVDLEDASLDDALALAKTNLDEIRSVKGSEAIALMLSPWMSNEGLFLGKKLGELLGAGSVGMLPGYNKRPIVPVMSDVLPKTLVSDDKTPNSSGGRLMNITEGEENFTFGHELLTAIDSGKIKGLILFHEDLAARSDFEMVAVRKSMAMLDFLMVVSWKPTEIGSQAHVLIPSLTWAEKKGTFTNHGKRVQRFSRAVSPLKLANSPDSSVPDELQILTALGRRFDESFGFDAPAEAFQALAEAEAAFKGLAWEEIGDTGVLAGGGEE